MNTTKLVLMAAIGGLFVSAPAIAKEKNNTAPLATANGNSANAGSGKTGTAGNSDNVPPGRCVSEIAREHSGGGISDEVKEECGLPPASK